MKKQSYAFTISTGKGNNNESNSKLRLPLHMIQKLQTRNKHHIKTSIHDITGNHNHEINKDPTQNMIDELIERLCITQKYLSPTVLIDIIALTIRSYLSEELHIRLTQPLRYFIHSPFHPFGITLFPPRNSNISSPLAFNDNLQFQPLIEYQLDNFSSRFSHAVFIGNEKFPTLILSTPQIGCLYIQSNKPGQVIQVIPNEVIHVWKQDNSAYICCRSRLRGNVSRIQLFMVNISNIDGLPFVSKLIDKDIKLKSTVDYRIFGAYYHTQSVQTNESHKAIKDGFPNDNFLIIVGETIHGMIQDSINVIITPKKCIHFENSVNLHCLWYYPTENKFIAIERKQYHLVSLGFNAEKPELFIMEKYRKITGTGIQHYFYDANTDMIVIYKKLMASSKFKNELIFLPVSSQLMIPEK